MFELRYFLVTTWYRRLLASPANYYMWTFVHLTGECITTWNKQNTSSGSVENKSYQELFHSAKVTITKTYCLKVKIRIAILKRKPYHLSRQAHDTIDQVEVVLLQGLDSLCARATSLRHDQLEILW
jgi:hypothetical protein